MSRQMDSGALTQLSEILRLGGGGEQTTTLDDGNVSQVLPIEKIIRRSLTFARSSGIFWFGFQTIHVGAGVLTSSIDPWLSNPGVNAYPTIMPRGFDVWVLYCSARRLSGAGDLTGGSFEIALPANSRGKGTAMTALLPIGIWDSIETITLQESLVTQDGDTMLRPNLRLPQDAFLQFRTNSTGVATFDCVAVLGVFPSGLDQDVAT